MEQTRRRALVTGASGGIGAACARALSKDCDVIVHYGHNREAAEKVLASLEPGDHQIIGFDIADEESVADAIKALEAAGGIDILVNNAGITNDKLLMRLKDEDFARVIDVNLSGAARCIRGCTRGMMKRRFGRIINISSIVGLRGNAGQAAYAASKAGLIGLTKSAALELGGRGITANAVAPGFIETEMTAGLPEKVKTEMLSRISSGRFGEPEDVASVVAFLASDAAGYVSGQVIAVDGGMQ
jgi:3-oxoacyl-[acyl-carrier protein] reductase